MIRLWHLAGALALALAAIAPEVGSAQVIRHSGSLLDVDRARGTIALAEIGPWRLDTETTVITVRTVAVTAATHFLLARRAADARTGHIGDFIEEDLEAWAIYAGDFVTVDCAHRSGRLVALRIVVVEGVAP
jgi:hypothetical protein